MIERGVTERSATEPSTTEQRETPLLSVRDLRVEFLTEQGPVTAVDGVSFEIAPGEILGLAGESGSGKSTIARALLRTLRPPAVITGGEVLFRGEDVLGMSEPELRAFRWKRVAMVFQSAMNSLNPVLTVGAQIADVILAHEATDRTSAWRRARELLQRVGISAERADGYPHQLSGGMRQRVGIALALALDPELLILDEPTTALDVVVQREILHEIAEWRAERGFSILFITHDLSLMFQFVDTLAISYAGKLVEHAPAAEVLEHPRHPYTRGLLQSFPSLHGPRVRLSGIAGTPPSLHALPSGCRFHPRCSKSVARCRSEIPLLSELNELNELNELSKQLPRHAVACHLPET